MTIITITTTAMTPTRFSQAGDWKQAAGVSLERLNEILHDLAHTEKYGTVLRAKGMLPDENGVWHYFDMVPEETEVREGAPIYTGKVCVIGSGLKEDDLKELFH